jgi:hypothetical protein
VPGEEAMHGADPRRSAALDQPSLDLDQGDVAHLGNQSFDEIAVRFDPTRMAVAAARPGNSLAMLKGQAAPADRARSADPEMCCGRSATHAAVNRTDNPVPKIL